MNFHQLICIVQVSKNGFNASSVAKKIGVVPSNISQHISNIEDELKLKIFTRNGSRIIGMTEAGKEIIAVAEKILDLANSIKLVSNDFIKSHE